MSFIDHLEELRWAIIRSLVAVGLAAAVVFAFKGFFIDDVIFGPAKSDFIGYAFLCRLSNWFFLDNSLCFTNALDIQNHRIIGQFMTHFKMSFIAGFILAFPYVFYEVWKFVRPGLYKNEVTAMRGVVAASWFFFVLGVLFGYFIILPAALHFLYNYILSASINNLYHLSDYTGYITMATLGAGIMFELPVVIFLLAKLGLVTPQFLKKYRKHAIIVILILASIITPPDVGTQLLIGFPVYLLYELSILVAHWVVKKDEATVSNT